MDIVIETHCYPRILKTIEEMMEGLKMLREEAARTRHVEPRKSNHSSIYVIVRTGTSHFIDS